ncbi:bifunctional DNA primase/polymerase [Streptomyces colonosanans]|uniref:DNA primase n=1 Tax=Streptomyces colonosanans TaxID=1428652 RepID=A0A1S2P9R4_9ACTN|nr:bifunctional DNA primase/polymerase [Streptomyces colonosanans]OIJ89764.1 DNA primase [Streptomyces colonosanans]
MHHNTPAPLPRTALAAAERGWHVFPLIPGAKRPAIRSWEQRATVDAERVTRCWSTGGYNLGIATGPSRLLVVDLDVPKHDQDTPPAGTPKGVSDGTDALALLAEQHGQQWPGDTYTVRTASGGVHLYFSVPAGAKLRNSAGTLGWKVDTRAGGGYVVGAGSTVDGKTYAVVRDAEVAPLPEWMTKLLITAPLPPQRPATVPLIADGRRGSYLTVAVNAERGRVSDAPEGRRNSALYEASVALGQLVAGHELTATYVCERLLEAATDAGLPEREARRTIASGLRAGAKRPRTFGRRAA